MAFIAKMDVSHCSGNQESEEDPKVDIMECGNHEDELQVEVLCESSSTSSFGYSMCTRDSGFGDREDEAQSMLSRDYPLPETFDHGTEFLGLRKKKVTDDWRRFSHPLAWRCKWVELKVKEILSQARGYEREVKDYYETKEFDLEKSKLEGLEGKSVPFRVQTPRMKVFKRGRRKRVEETTDIAAYRSNHNLFSYADKRMPAAVKAQSLESDIGTGRKATSKDDDDCLVSELDCSGDFLPRLLCKIEEAQERTARLKNRVDQLMMESQTAPETLAPCPAQNGKQRALLEEPLTPQTTARNQKEATVQIGRQRISADHTEDLLVPQAPPIQIGGECLNNYSPVSSGGLQFHSLLMDEPDMNDDMDAFFLRVMNDVTGLVPLSPEETDTEEDPTPVNKRCKTSD